MFRYGLAGLCLLPCSASAAVVAASAPNADVAIAAVKPGDSVVLTAGVYPRVDIRACLAAPGATLDASAAGVVINWLYMPSACHWTIKGGEFAAAKYQAIQITGASAITLMGGYVHHWGSSGVGIGGSNDIAVQGYTFAHSLGDAIDVTGSNRVTITGNVGFDLTYVPGGNHADFVQAWGGGSGLTIARNVVICACQGFDNFGDGDGSTLSDVTVRDNVIATSTTTAGSFAGVGGASVMTGNFAMTLVGMPRGWGGARWVMTAPAAPTVAVTGAVLASPGAVTFSGNTDGVAP